MTMPPLAPIDQGDGTGAADQLSKLVAGNDNLVTNPHLVSALLDANATPEQAQTINMFTAGLQSTGRIQAARIAGAKITFAPAEKSVLDAMGVDYHDVEFTNAMRDAEIKKAQLAKQESAAKKMVQHAANSGGSPLDDLWGGIKAAGSGVMDGLNKAANFVGSNASHLAEGVKNDVEQMFGAAGGSNPQTEQLAASAEQAHQKDQEDAYRRSMKAAGYDPDNPLSVLAYRASGKDTLDLTGLYHSNDPRLVDAAVKYADDPQGYIQGLVDSENTNQLEALKTQEFQDLVTKVNSHRATVGNVLTQWIDPTKHPEAQHVLSTGLDVAFNFATDPTLAVLGAVKAVKLSKLALDGAGDGAKVERLLDPATKGVYASRAQRAMQSFIDNTTAIREGVATGSDSAVAAGYARIRATTPGLEHLTSDFLGSVRPTGFAEAGLTFGKAEPITNLSEAAEYLSSSVGLARLRAGRPMVEGVMMPGQLSRYGFLRLRGALAGKLATRGVRRDSKLVINLNKPGMAARLLPKDGDSVDVASGRAFVDNGDGTVNVVSSGGVERAPLDFTEENGLHAVHNAGVTQLSRLDDGSLVEKGTAGATGDTAAQAPQGLPSQVRGTHSEFGDAVLASRKGVLGGLPGRGRLIVQRVASYLPRSTSFATDDPSAVKRVFQYGNMYLTRGHANLLAGLYAAGDEGVRKAILKGMEIQTLHAAGLSATEGGRAIIQSAEHTLDDSRYASAPGGLDDIIDPATGEPMRAAIHGGQVNPTVTLTGFSDIHKVAAKIGIWESTIGRVFNNQLADNLMGAIKPGWLMTGTNVVRNAGEDLFGAGVRGEYGDVVKAKTIAESKGMLPKRTRLGNVVVAPLARVGQMLRKAQINPDDENLGLKYVAALDPELTLKFADDWTHLHAASMVDPSGARQSDEITRIGFMPRAMKLERTGYSLADTNGQLGAERMAAALGVAVNRTPEHVKAILDHLANPELNPIDSVVASLKDPANAKWVGQMKRAGTYLGEDGQWHKALTAAEKELALTQLAETQAKDLKYLLSDKDGNLIDNVVGHIRTTGKAPTASWIVDNLADAERVPAVQAPMFEPVPIDQGITGFVGAISDVAGKGYRHLVEMPIARLSTMPVFLSNYGKSRYLLREVEQSMVTDGGLTAETADKLSQRLALEMAFNRTVKYIDDPTLRTQMDIVGRNFFAFSRATQAFVRRWGIQFVEDPARLRKAMLTMESAEHVGLTYKDQNGDEQFIFPGSGLAIEAVQKLENVLSLGGRIPGLNVYQLPVAADLTGKVALLQPGLQNPLQMSLTPMVNMPMRTIFNLFPQHKKALDEVDAFLNGQQGRGQSIWAEMEPTAIKKFSDAINTDDRNSMMASSSRQAILNLMAARLEAQDRGVPTAELNKIFPDATATAEERDAFLQNIRTQTKNQLLLRAVLGFFSPSPPGHPSEATDGSKQDWFYGPLGVRGLADEWKALLNEAGGDYGKATRIWTALHPDKTFYEVPATQSSTRDATVAATAATQSWMEGHLDFLKKYKGVSAYFLPVTAQDGQFDLGAYNAQLELGLRQHKSLSEFYTDVRIKNAEELYFDGLNKRDAALTGETNPAAVKRINDQFTQWYASLKAHNPLFEKKISSFTDELNTAKEQLATLRKMVTDHPSGVAGMNVVSNMIDAYDKFHAGMTQFKGSTLEDKLAHQTLRTQYNDWFQNAVAENPQFKGLYQGVFRTLDTKALQSMGTQL